MIPEKRPRLFVVMGVAGCGKSTIGMSLAKEIDGIYLEGDALHPPANVEKMSSGTPLTDEDRWPWLDKIAVEMKQSEGTVLVGCSALKRVYRDRLRGGCNEPVMFLHLSGSRELIAKRMERREGHFMPLSLLDSQFAALEPLQNDEMGICVDIDATAAQIVAHILAALPANSG